MNIEFDLKEILTRFESKFDKLEASVKSSFDKLDAKIERLEGKFDKLEDKFDKLAEDVSNVKGEVKALEAKVDGIGKQIDTQEFINRGVIIGLILAVLGGFAKVFGFVPPNP